MRSHKRTVAFIVMISLFLMSFSFLPKSHATLSSEYAAVEKKITQMRDKLANLSGDRKAIEAQLADNEKSQNELINKKELLDKKIAVCGDEIDLTEEYIQSLGEDIAAKEQLILENEKAEAEKYELFKLRVRAMHEEGSVSYVGVILGAESFYDLLSRIEIIERLVEYDDKVISDLIEVRRTIVESKEALEADKADKDEVKANLIVMKSELDVQLEESVQLIANLKSEESNAVKAYAAAEAEQDRLNDEIKKQTAELAKISKYVGGDFVWPIPGYYTVTSPYGMRTHPVLKTYKLHTGTDIGAPKGTKIVAMNDGTVLISDYNSGYGNYVTINHGGGYATLYAHMSKRAVSKGDKIKQGDVIGYVGTTGYSTGNHLHFEVIISGKTTDPMKYFK